ncbi:hypothetical protein [Fictibacillus phosphorivorans]|uniref:hypothetical protein n=1 Tax=Fictibacillus phosphorivorans TaxID=1221500 RepID=UPI0018E8C548
MRHLRVKRTNVAHRLPRGKRATWSGNQLLSGSKFVYENSLYKIEKNRHMAGFLPAHYSLLAEASCPNNNQ